MLDAIQAQEDRTQDKLKGETGRRRPGERKTGKHKDYAFRITILSVAADGTRTDGRLLRLADVARRGGDTDLVGRRCRARPEDHTLLPAAPAVRAACGGIRAAGRGTGAPAGRGAELSHTNTEGIDIMLAIDVSGSMLARDFRPDRITAAKEVAGSFIADRYGDRIGLVAFAGEAFTQSPADHRPGDVADPAVAHPQRPDRGRHGDRQRPGDGDQPPARERGQVEGNHPADRRREQPRRDRAADGGRDRQGAGHPRLHDRRRHRGHGPLPRRGHLRHAHRRHGDGRRSKSTRRPCGRSPR